MIDYFSWWGRVESNHLPSGYEPPALTDELRPLTLPDIIAYFDLVGYTKDTVNMNKINIRRWYYHIRHRYATIENVVVTVALVIGAGWAWGSVGMMQRNYDLQKNIDTKLRHQKLIELEVELARYQQNYYQSNEYKAWSARKNFGLANPGEKVLILPANSARAKNADSAAAMPVVTPASKEPDNFTQWVNFLFGGSR